MSEKQCDLIKEEYNRKWDYVRHIEELRTKYIQWYFLISGGMLSYLFSQKTDISNYIKNKNSLIVLTFLVFYSISFKIIILFQKKNYKYYTDRLMDIEKKYCGMIHSFKKKRIFTAFRTIYLSLSLVGSGIFFLFIYLVNGHLIFSFISSIIYLILVNAATFIPIFKH